ILRRALGGCRAAVGCCLDLGGHTLGKVFELLDQYSTTAEITFDRCGLKQQPQCPSKSNPIESRKNPYDVLSKFANKALWNTVGRWYWLSFHTPLLSSPTAFHHDLVAALPRCDLLRLFQSSFYLCAFASLADVAKGGDGAKSALPEILLRLFFAFFVPFRGHLFSP